MKPFAKLFALPTSLLILLSHAAADNSAPTAIKKLPPSSNEKLLAEHLAFAAIPILSPRDAAAAAISFLDSQDGAPDGTTRYHPAFARHFDDAEYNVLRRAAEALALLHRREACPSGFNSCSDIEASNKCCQDGTYCVAVEDSSVGGVACCPEQASCGGGVGACPSDATSCSEELGGGCCIPGYVCEGLGCVPSASATRSTVVQTLTEEPTLVSTTEQASESEEPTITTEAETTEVETTSDEETTSTEIATGTATRTATGAAPYRPISSATASETDSADTQTGCPTGYYGCLATHGGGCCRTDRDCNTYDCPAPSTTIVSGGATIVILATDAPPAAADDATSTCADGWFLCGRDAGTVAGCCPSDYDCGTASCFTSSASQTGKVQKEFPKDDSAARGGAPWVVLGGLTGALCLLVAM
ncbi:hypothetical protein QQZ08_005663 [Neonectria magnoliae]|uniref:GPI anchored protein n=1 Tax=Neonectria magnoliae TaxID=2732573 RepID=A0ABR1I2Y2_9HYPO